MHVSVEVRGLERLNKLVEAARKTPEDVVWEIGRDMIREFRTSPLVPRKTGGLRSSHTLRRAGAGEVQIVSVKRLGPYLHAGLVILGHRTLATPGQRRYWFFLLRRVYGGSYKRRAPGGPGVVLGRPYHRQIAQNYAMRGRVRAIVNRVLSRRLGG